jgi:hypothetical protein
MLEMDLSFDEIDDLFDKDFNDEDFGIDSEYFDNEEYIDDEIEKPVEVKPLEVKPQVKPQMKPQVKSILKPQIKQDVKPILKPQLNQVKPEVKERQNMSYDDILKSMNVTLVNGKLVLSKGTHNNVEQIKEENTTKRVQFSQEPIPQEVKNSSIYNKYFKTYNSIQPTVEVRRPQTIQEYRQMLLEDKIKRIQAKRRIDMIKPKTLLFSRDSNPVINMRQPTNLNKIFNFPR